MEFGPINTPFSEVAGDAATDGMTRLDARPSPRPTIGRIVHYTLSAGDVAQINQRRAALKSALQAGGEPSPYIGNTVEAGQTYPAQIVRHFSGTTVNLKVALDGPDDYWATSRAEHIGEGDGHGSWAWPPRV